MTWSKTPPTEEGCYWWRRCPEDSPEPVRLDGDYWERLGYLGGLRADEMGGEWFSVPIQPPGSGEGTGVDSTPTEWIRWVVEIQAGDDNWVRLRRINEPLRGWADRKIALAVAGEYQCARVSRVVYSI